MLTQYRYSCRRSCFYFCCNWLIQCTQTLWVVQSRRPSCVVGAARGTGGEIGRDVGLSHVSLECLSFRHFLFCFCNGGCAVLIFSEIMWQVRKDEYAWRHGCVNGTGIMVRASSAGRDGRGDGGGAHDGESGDNPAVDPHAQGQVEEDEETASERRIRRAMAYLASLNGGDGGPDGATGQSVGGLDGHGSDDDMMEQNMDDVGIGGGQHLADKLKRDALIRRGLLQRNVAPLVRATILAARNRLAGIVEQCKAEVADTGVDEDIYLNKVTGHNVLNVPDATDAVYTGFPALARIHESLGVRCYGSGKQRRSMTGVDVSHDGEHIVTSSKDGTLVAWDTERHCRKWTFHAQFRSKHTSHVARQGHVGPVLCCTLDGNKGKSTLVSGGADGAVRVWDVRSGQCVRVMRGHKGGVNCLASRKGSDLIFSGGADRKVMVWNVDNYSYMQTLYGHEAGVNDIDALYKERALSVGEAATMRLWKGTFTFYLILS